MGARRASAHRSAVGLRYEGSALVERGAFETAGSNQGRDISPVKASRHGALSLESVADERADQASQEGVDCPFQFRLGLMGRVGIERQKKEADREEHGCKADSYTEQRLGLESLPVPIASVLFETLISVIGMFSCRNIESGILGKSAERSFVT
jgi:hypothetical protein